MDTEEIISFVADMLSEKDDVEMDVLSFESFLSMRWKDGQLVVDLETNEIVSITHALSPEDAETLSKVEAQLRSTLPMKMSMDMIEKYSNVKMTGSIQ
jgi:hypothetical protein